MAPPPSQQFGKTRIMNEIQEQIKSNFEEELNKLRSEMNSRQKELRKQMESLKAEADRALRERNEANEEVRRMKELLDKKKDQEGYQTKLASAINKYAPPGENEYREVRAASRGGVNMNMYEKMFFANGGKDMQTAGQGTLLGGKSLKAESALLPIDHDKTITNYFNKNIITKQQETFKYAKGGVPIFESSPEQLKNTNIEMPTINTNIKNQIRRDKAQFDYGVDDDASIKADDTFDFLSKINGIGGGKKKTEEPSMGRREPKANRLNKSGISENPK